MNIDVASLASVAPDATAGATGQSSDGAADKFAQMVAQLTDIAARPDAGASPATRDDVAVAGVEAGLVGTVAETGGDDSTDDAGEPVGTGAAKPDAPTNPLPAAVLAAFLATRLLAAADPEAAGTSAGTNAVSPSTAGQVDPAATGTPEALAVMSDPSTGSVATPPGSPTGNPTGTPQSAAPQVGVDEPPAAPSGSQPNQSQPTPPASAGASSATAGDQAHDPAVTQLVAAHQADARAARAARGARTADDADGTTAGDLAAATSDGPDGTTSTSSMSTSSTSSTIASASASVTTPTLESITVPHPTPLATPPTTIARAAAAAPAQTTTPSPADLPVVDPNVARIGGAVRTLHGGAGRMMSLEMSPADLGRVRIDLVSRDGRVEVVLSAEHHRAADLLRGSTDALRREIEGSGVTLDAVHVGVSSEGGRHTDGRSFDADELASDTGGQPPSATRLGGGGAVPRPAPLSQLRRPVHAGGVDLDL